MADVAWRKPRENSIAALEYGMEHADGVEMDLRLTAEGEVVIHHDPRTPSGKYPERYGYDDLKQEVALFDDLLDSSRFVDRWISEARFVCLELKAPHPSSGAGGGWLRGKKMHDHLSRLLESVRSRIEEIQVPVQSTVFYSFDPYITPVANSGSGKYRHARLMPKLRQWGNWSTQRAVASPSFVSTSVPRLLAKQRRLGAPMLPLALEYIHGWTRHIPLGTSVGLKGAALDRFNRIRRGHPVYVWPAPLELEPQLLDAGLSCISDSINPQLANTDGSNRCMRPATMPEIEGVRQPWHEISRSERMQVITEWRKKWGWSTSLTDLKSLTSESTMPWEMPRLIGHRGTGKNKGTL